MHKTPNISHSGYIGGHASITPSILQGIQYFHKLGANAIQIFLGPSQSSSLKSKHTTPLDEIKSINEYIKQHDIKLIVHAVYTLNLCSYPPTSQRIKYALDNIIYDMEMGQRLGVSAVVVHTGSYGVLDTDTAYNNMAENIAYILAKTLTTAPNVCLCMETPAGQGKQIATNLTDIAMLWNKCRDILDANTARLGICIDTAHLFSSGYDLRKPAMFLKYLDEFDRVIGKANIKLIHLNDSKVDLNAKRDVHQGIGDGFLFGKQYAGPDDYLQTIRELLMFAKKSRIPVILETHGASSITNPGGELYAQELVLLKHLQTKKPIDSTWKLIQMATKKTASSIINSQAKTKKASKPLLNIGIINKLKALQFYYQNVAPDKFRAIAYGRAIIAIRGYPEEILNGQQLEHLLGVGPKIIEKIDEYLATGTMKIFSAENIDAKTATWILNNKQNAISAVLGFGNTRVKKLNIADIKTVSGLKKAVAESRIKLTATETLGLKYHADLMKMIPRRETERIFKKCMVSLAGLIGKYGLRLELAGSYPSGKKSSKDIDILIFTDKYPDVLNPIPKQIIADISEQLYNAGLILDVISRGTSKLMAIVKLNGTKPARHLDIRLLPAGAEICGRMYFTSGRDFNVMLRSHAKQMGYKLNEYGLFDGDGNLVPNITSEADIMAKLGLSFIPMADRR